jgi:hypothetical protein
MTLIPGVGNIHCSLLILKRLSSIVIELGFRRSSLSDPYIIQKTKSEVCHAVNTRNKLQPSYNLADLSSSFS